MKTNISIIIILSVILSFTTSTYAASKGVSMTLPDGKVVSLDGLSTEEIGTMSVLIEKVAKAKAKSELTKTSTETSQVVINAMNDPEKLDAWRKMITGTIKDTCIDLNVAVNEFIKTPVGLGVSALILYNVAGRDVLGAGARILSTIVKIIILVPLWFIIIGTLLFLRKKYLSTMIIYNKRKEVTEESGKHSVLYTEPEVVTSYPWKGSDARVGFTWVLCGTGIISTIAFTAIILL